jgi:hypothetical protein
MRILLLHEFCFDLRPYEFAGTGISGFDPAVHFGADRAKESPMCQFFLVGGVVRSVFGQIYARVSVVPSGRWKVLNSKRLPSAFLFIVPEILLIPGISTHLMMNE